MKKIKYLVMCLVAALLVNCNDAIDIRQVGLLDPANAFRSVDDLEAGVFGLYSRNGQSGAFGFDTTPEIALASNFTDEISIGAGTGGQGFALYDFVLNPTSAAASNFWIRNFSQNNRATVLLEAAQNITVDPSDQARYNQLLGEIYVMRAYANFELLNMFSVDVRNDASLGIPVVDFVPPLTFQPLRDTVGDGWDYINSDIAAAESLLGPATAPDRISLDVVRAFKARTLATRGRYAEALPIANALVAAYPIANRTDYRNMFLDDSDEEIIFKLQRVRNGPFDRQGATGSVNAGGWPGAVYTFADILSDAYFEMDRKTFNMIDPNDIRYTVNVSPASVIDPTYMTNPNAFSTDKIIPAKYPGSEQQPLMNDLKVFRSSEMLLIAAEARVGANNDLTGAAQLIKQLRDARFGSAQPLPVYASAQEAYGAILDERRIELLFEGHRFRDLKRLGVAGNRGVDRDLTDCTRQGGACTLPADDFRFTLPIPLSEINANPGIGAEQNPGY
ncbi:RagB/SusD family nutrient uptake outer membrane protein [Winogradskyella litorisediminis]